jgi:hypothetical protein
MLLYENNSFILTPLAASTFTLSTSPRYSKNNHLIKYQSFRCSVVIGLPVLPRSISSSRVIPTLLHPRSTALFHCFLDNVVTLTLAIVPSYGLGT